MGLGTLPRLIFGALALVVISCVCVAEKHIDHSWVEPDWEDGPSVYGDAPSIFDDAIQTFETAFQQESVPASDWDDGPAMHSNEESLFDDAIATSKTAFERESVALVRDAPDGKLAPDERGLALLRSPALADKALRIIGVVGQARTGKSFFLNSLVGKARTFEVSSGDEGFTKGLWLHQLDHATFAAPPTATATAPQALPAAAEHDNMLQDRLPEADAHHHETEGGVLSEDVATILIDSEGLGAPGGSKVYDTKMVALTAMLSSITFYNNMRKVNKMDVEFLGDVVLFDEIFRSMTDQPLLASEIVWLVQVCVHQSLCVR